MAEFLKNVFGGSGAAPSQAAAGDADFADYAGAPDPSPASISAIPPGASNPSQPFSTGGARPYTKWYRVWERTSRNEFQLEMYILPFLLVILVFHLWGMRLNRKKAKNWVRAHAPILQQEFAVVGFGGRKSSNMDEDGLAKSMAGDQLVITEDLLKEKTANEYITYATGRQNIAFMDVKLTLLKRYNPIMRFGETALGFFFESLPPTEERMEASIYNFDGRESQLVPSNESAKKSNSSYDGFVWAVVHKNLMKRLRDERYDLSLTTTKDHAKLPAWATVMSESAEITETLLTADLIKAVEASAEHFEALIISDQPIDQPKKLDELIPKKRITLSLRLPSNDSYTPTLALFTSTIRLADTLASSGGRFRPEALRRVKQTRDEEMRKIRKLDETEKAEDRKQRADREKKEKRDATLKNLSAEEQRKFLEKEREKSMRKGQKKQTVKG